MPCTAVCANSHSRASSRNRQASRDSKTDPHCRVGSTCLHMLFCCFGVPLRVWGMDGLQARLGRGSSCSPSRHIQMIAVIHVSQPGVLEMSRPTFNLLITAITA
jgi:hypothetical protein